MDVRPGAAFNYRDYRATAAAEPARQGGNLPTSARERRSDFSDVCLRQPVEVVRLTARLRSMRLLVEHVLVMGIPLQILKAIVAVATVPVAALMEGCRPWSNEGFQHDLMNQRRAASGAAEIHREISAPVPVELQRSPSAEKARLATDSSTTPHAAVVADGVARKPWHVTNFDPFRFRECWQ